MACHNMDPAFWCLDLGAPIKTKAQTSGINDDTYPAWEIITYSFAAKGDRPAVDLVWYDGGKIPEKPNELGEVRLSDNGCMMIGEQGVLVGGSHAAAPRLYPIEKTRNLEDRRN